MDGQKGIDILFVDDNPGDVRLVKEALSDMKEPSRLFIAEDGIEAMDYLRKRGRHAAAPRPDLVLLDLNLPRKNGFEVLNEIKSDDDLKQIPVCVLTSSSAERDVSRAYKSYANCYIVKPLDYAKFLETIKQVQEFWLKAVRLPQKQEPNP
ncbi:MAG: response regulator [Chloroflexi bacterium]|nr:response regulator [Chloroflexota bacterium]